ncbi:hypothetical protein AWC38_SpisGene14947 [Stylophora pistillata]|uniref:Peptidase A2 domain-containing protein n=1 Tax=Stylophora pistillata TaxID=50429 RepID=A0A2B4RWA0_STYPI|nr:hypothetical protein AWC38_SpisGene14947 [Stylophora pistillata]
MADILAKCNQYFLGQTQEFSERFQFNHQDQASGILDVKTCKELLSTHDLTLNTAVKICRALEAASLHMKALRHEEMNKIKDVSRKTKKHGLDKHHHKTEKPPQGDDQNSVKKKCLFYLQIHLMKKKCALPEENLCSLCAGEISTVTAHEDHVVNSVNPGNQLIFCKVEINKGCVRIQIDSGTTACILPKHYVGDRQIRPERVHLQMQNKTSFLALSKCKVTVKNPATKKEYKVDFVIVDNRLLPLLSSVAPQKMDLLKCTIEEGWPADESSLPTLVTPYYSVRDELAVTDGLIFRGESPVIPNAMQATVKKDIHSRHQGIEACLRHTMEQARHEQGFKYMDSHCETCKETELTPCKETLMSHEIPEGGGKKIGADLFTHHDKECLVRLLQV